MLRPRIGSKEVQYVTVQIPQPRSRLKSRNSSKTSEAVLVPGLAGLLVQQSRLSDQHPRNSHSLLLTTRELVGLCFCNLFQLDVLGTIDILVLFLALREHHRLLCSLA